jgi:hypothetical protein
MAPTGGQVLKDLDYVRLKADKGFMNMEKGLISKILKHLQTDVRYLQGQGFMDYSLLLSVRKVKDDELEKKLTSRMDLDLSDEHEAHEHNNELE